MRFTIGDRVRVSDSYHWAQGEHGTITAFDGRLRYAGDWRRPGRLLETLRGGRPLYWVMFDSDRLDADGDGPYAGASIPAEDLVLVRKSSEHS